MMYTDDPYAGIVDYEYILLMQDEDILLGVNDNIEDSDYENEYSSNPARVQD